MTEKRGTVQTVKDERLLAIARSLSNVPWSDEYEKMISGVLYDALCAPLAEARFRARRLLASYNFAPIPENATLESVTSERAAKLQGLFGKVGKNVFVEPPLQVDYGCNIQVGDNFYANFNAVMLDCSLIIIGDRVMFGPNVSIYTAGHPLDVTRRRAGDEFAREIVIGDDCWIGGGVTVLPGVTIGRGCTIGAGSVVVSDIPEYSVAVGSPARVVKKVEKPMDDE